MKDERLTLATITARQEPLETLQCYVHIAPYGILALTSLRRFVLHASEVWHCDL